MEQQKSIFMVHKHHATHLHYDIRVEMGGTLKSWALKELPLQPSRPVLAIQVPDHPFWYRHFEGIIPEGQYGAGPVMVWDKGLYNSFTYDHPGHKISVDDALKRGYMLLWLEGHKLQGGYLFIRISRKQRWLIIKLEDKFVIHGRKPSGWNRSIKSKKTLAQIVDK